MEFRFAAHETSSLIHQSEQMVRSPEERAAALIAANGILDHFLDARAREEAKIVSQLETAAVWEPTRTTKPLPPTSPPRTGMHQPIEGGERSIRDIGNEFYD